MFLVIQVFVDVKMIWRTLAAHGRLVFKRALSAEPPPIIFTDRAVQRLKKITKGGEHLRITVEGGGCAGFEYKFSLDSNRAEDDVVIKKEGAELVVDQVSDVTFSLQ